MGQRLLAVGSVPPAQPLGTSTSRARQAGTAISKACPACPSRVRQQPGTTEAWTRVSPKTSQLFPTGVPAGLCTSIPAAQGCPQEPPDALARACPRFLRARSPQEQSPGLLPQALVPPPSFCPTGLHGSRPGYRRAPQVERAQAAGADRADMEDGRVLGEDEPQAGRGQPTTPCWGCELCIWASPGLLRPRAPSLELLPCSCLENRSLLQPHVPSMPPQHEGGL